MKNYVKIIAFLAVIACFSACSTNRNRDLNSRDTLSGGYQGTGSDTTGRPMDAPSTGDTVRTTP